MVERAHRDETSAGQVEDELGRARELVLGRREEEPGGDGTLVGRGLGAREENLAPYCYRWVIC